MPVLLAGQPGLGFPQARAKLLRVIGDTPPRYLVLHVGANDIARVDQKQWLQELDELVCFIRAYWPAATLVWSDMLPRVAWRYARSQQGAENSRRRLNRKARCRILEENGKIIYHPDINEDCLLPDGVHLNQRGNEILKLSFDQQLTNIILN